MLLKRNFIIWLGLFILAFINGAIRELGIKKIIDEPWAHHLSAITAIVLFSFYVFFLWSKTGIKTSYEALMIGLFWFTLTVLTETFLLNRYISKLSWKEVLETYNVLEGRSWPLVLFWLLILPWIVLKIS